MQKVVPNEMHNEAVKNDFVFHEYLFLTVKLQAKIRSIIVLYFA